ncbi:LysM peptidoglycan-binding domain-containing protein [Schaalia cardiffensis]|nr:LysM peptidoglycan-binding domain-containing protein [Schaalia cardiffensis]
MSTQNSALRLERRHLVSVPPISGADVVEISTAPSVRRRREALLAEDPAMHRRPCASRLEGERDGALGAPFSLASVVRFALGLMAALALGVAGVGIGMLLSPGVYSGPTAVHGVVAGESIWSIAQGVNTDRPLEDVVTDIRALNDVEGALMVGQQIKVPIR